MKPRLMTAYSPPTEPLRVIHEDAEIVLVDKPSKLLSVPGKPAEHWDCVEHRVRVAYPDSLLIHRLDLETSGLMIFARTRHAQKLINGQFERRIVRKTYIARVAGTLWADGGRIDLPLIADWPRRPMQKVCFDTGKPSITRWRVLARDEGSSQGDAVTRVELSPETGRSHQLRVHLNEIGHPILGDPFYAPEDIYRAADRLQLHAQVLELRHPEDGRWVRFEAACPF